MRQLLSYSWTTSAKWAVLNSEIRCCATLLCVSSPLTFKCDYLVLTHNTALDDATTFIKLQRKQQNVLATLTKTLIWFFLFGKVKMRNVSSRQKVLLQSFTYWQPSWGLKCQNMSCWGTWHYLRIRVFALVTTRENVVDSCCKAFNKLNWDENW